LKIYQKTTVEAEKVSVSFPPQNISTTRERNNDERREREKERENGGKGGWRLSLPFLEAFLVRSSNNVYTLWFGISMVSLVFMDNFGCG
jgi:hypothetical protein